MKNSLTGLIDTAKKDNDIVALFLFGSRARRQERTDSDIDVCLVMSPSKCSYSNLSKKRMSYLNLYNIDIQIFQQLPVYIRSRIVKEGKLLLCKDEGMLYKIVFDSIRELGDFEHIYNDYLQEVLNA